MIVHAEDGTAIKSGLRVASLCPGTWAECAAVPSNRFFEVPPDVSDEAACQISLNPATAWALLEESGAASGDWMLVTATTSTVSNIVGAVAHRRGIR